MNVEKAICAEGLHHMRRLGRFTFTYSHECCMLASANMSRLFKSPQSILEGEYAMLGWALVMYFAWGVYMFFAWSLAIPMSRCQS